MGEKRTILSVKDLGINFGGLQAVKGVSFDVLEKQIVGLIGPNGAGKTTVFNLLTSVYTPTEGTITLDGKLLHGEKTYKVVKYGIGRTFQNIRLFKGLSVIDNVKIALNNEMSYGTLTGLLRLPKYWKEEKAATDKAHELLKVFDLDGLADITASNLT